MTPKQAAFVREYCIDRNATQAAIRAGYSEKTAAAIGFENLRKPSIAAAVDALELKHAEKCGVTKESLTKELEAARKLAEDTKQPGAAVAAVMGKAKIHGLLVDKQEQKGDHTVTVVSGVTRDGD